MKTQKIPNSQRNPEKNQSWSHQNPDFKLYYKTIIIILKTMVLEKQIYRSMKPNLKPRNKHTHRWTTNLQQKRHKKYN